MVDFHLFFKVLQQLDELLNDLKTDMNKFPMAIAQLPTVSKRLGMSERGILSQLTGSNANAASASTSAAPPPSDDQSFPFASYYKAGPQFALPVSLPSTLKNLQRPETEEKPVEKGKKKEKGSWGKTVENSEKRFLVWLEKNYMYCRIIQ